MLPGPSFLNMAEAMLEEEYKSSHFDLKQFGDTFSNGKENHETRQESMNAERRVVIQVPPKRRKISHACNTPKDVVDAINTSMSEEDRVEALNQALLSFDHHQHSIHDKEIEENADIALVKMLAFLEFKTGFRRHPIKADLGAITNEIGLTCQALEMVYRASSDYVGLSFDRVGIDLLHILVILIDEEVKYRMKAIVTPNTTPGSGPAIEGNIYKEKVPEMQMNSQQSEGSRPVTPSSLQGSEGVGGSRGDLVLRKATKILGHYARIGKATKAIAHFPGLLGSMLNLINMRPYDTIPWEARLSCLWTIANVSSTIVCILLCFGKKLTKFANSQNYVYTVSMQWRKHDYDHVYTWSCQCLSQCELSSCPSFGFN